MNIFYQSIKYLSFLLFITLLLSCSKQDNTIVIHPLDSSSDSFSIRTVRTIKLSNDSKALIGYIDKLLVHKNYVYVLDKKKVSSLLIFDLKGDLVNRIPRGKGPGELVSVISFGIINEKLVILDNFDMKHYSLNGQFEYSIKMPEGWYAWSFLEIDDNKVLIHGSASLENSMQPEFMDEYHLVDDKFSKCFGSYSILKKDFIGFMGDQPASSYNGRVLVSAIPYNFLYELAGTEFNKKYFVDFEGFNFLDSEIEKGSQNFKSLYMSGKRYGRIDNIIENQSFIHFSYWAWIGDKGNIVPVIYSKELKKAARFTDVLKKEGLPKLTVSHVVEEELVCFLRPAGLSEEEIESINRSDLIESIITANSNPIVVIIEVLVN